jgi:ribosomal protein L30E
MFPNINIYILNIPEHIKRKISMYKMLSKIGVNSKNIIFLSSQNINEFYYIKNTQEVKY